MSLQQELLGVASGDGTFLGRLPGEARQLLLGEAPIIEARRGQIVFSPNDAADRAGIVLRGTLRTFLSARDGRRLTVRYVRAGVMVGSFTADRAALSVQAVTDAVVLELNLATLQDCILADGRVGLLLIAEMALRFQDTHATLASNTFGSMRERVARHILDLAGEGPGGEGLEASVTQQGLADGVGTVREVVARILHDFRGEGLVTTTPGHIQILDADRLAAVIDHYRVIGR